MRVIWLQILIFGAAAGAAYVVPRLSMDQFLFLFLPPMLVCIVCGWILTFQSKAVRVAQNWKEHVLVGVLVPVPSNWQKPVRLSWAARVLLVSAAIPAGAAIRLLWIAHA